MSIYASPEATQAYPESLNDGFAQARDIEILALAHSSNLAGAQLALASLIKNTTDRIGWTVICPQDGPFVEEIEDHAVIKRAEYPWWCVGKNFQPTPIPMQSVKRINEISDTTHHDIALTNTITVPWLAYAAKRSQTPHLWYVHEYGDLDHGLEFPYGYDRSLEYINKNSDAVLTISEPVGDHIMQHGISPERLRYVKQSFDVDSFVELGPASDKNAMLIIGSIKESKGQLDALRAFAESTVSRDHTLTIAGPVTDPAYASAIEDYIATHELSNVVRFVPGRADTLDEMARADTILVCSKNEALGRVTLEALAAGRTVIGSDSGGTSTLLRESRGILYDGTIQGLVSKMDNLTTERDALTPLSARQGYVLQNYSAKSERESFFSVIDSVSQHASIMRPLSEKRLVSTGIVRALKEYALVS